MQITENTFAAACVEHNSAEELAAALERGPDRGDMASWGLTREEWYEQVELALRALLADLAGE